MPNHLLKVGTIHRRIGQLSNAAWFPRFGFLDTRHGDTVCVVIHNRKKGETRLWWEFNLYLTTLAKCHLLGRKDRTDKGQKPQTFSLSLFLNLLGKSVVTHGNTVGKPSGYLDNDQPACKYYINLKK